MNSDLAQIPNPFIPLLLSTQTHQICPRSHITSVNAYDTVEELQAVLQKHSVHSVPVLENGSCIGMVDGLNLAHYFFQDPATYIQRSRTTKIISLLLQTAKTPLPVFSNTNLLDVISIVAPGIHRAIVLKSESNHALYSVCSESDIISTIYCYLKASEPLEKNNLPVYMLSQFPLYAFSNYFANIKFDIDANASVNDGLKRVQEALVSTTTQSTPGGMATNAAALAGSNNTSPQQQQQQGDVDENNKIDETISIMAQPQCDNIIKPLKFPSREHTSLEWNAPITVVCDNDRIISYLNADTFHKNIVESGNVDIMCGNLNKTVYEFLTTVSKNSLIPIPASQNPIQSQQNLSQSPLEVFNPTGQDNPLGPIGVVVPETIPFGDLLELFTTYKLDYVWVCSQIHGKAKLVEAFPLSWFKNNALGLVTINDVLRLISRDNITLYPALLPLE